MKDERIHGIRIKCYALPESAGFDRFTVAYPTETHDGHSRLVSAVGLTGHTGAMLGRHLGKRVMLADLPQSLQATVRADCEAIAGVEK